MQDQPTRRDDPNASASRFVLDRGNADGSEAIGLVTTYAQPITLREALAREIERAERGNARVLRIEIVPDTIPADAQWQELPYSEVCCHMCVAGKRMWVAPVGGMAQLYTADGRKFSAPITRGEAGLTGDRG